MSIVATAIATTIFPRTNQSQSHGKFNDNALEAAPVTARRR